MQDSVTEWKVDMPPLTTRTQTSHDIASWTWEVGKHLLVLVSFLRIGRKALRWLESEEKSNTAQCAGILRQFPITGEVYR